MPPPPVDRGAFYMYKDYFKNPSVTVPVTPFADMHGAPMQRMYNLTCLAYGSDPNCSHM